MKYSSVIYAALFMVGLVSGLSSGKVEIDWLASVCLLGVVYVCGGTHGLYLGLSHNKRMELYVNRSVSRYYESPHEGEHAA